MKIQAMNELDDEVHPLHTDQAVRRTPMSFGSSPPFASNVQIPHRPDPASAFEKHYSVKELATLWNLSDRTIRRMFVGEPGVVAWGASERRRKRAYKTLRIPESVARRVHRRLRKVG